MTLKKIISTVSKFLLVSVFGLSSCINAVEYGSPYAEYELKGRVTDEDSNPIPGIKVSLDDPQNRYNADTTDISGEFEFNKERIFPPGDRMKVFFQDIDGPENGGEFALDSLELDVYQIEEGSRWYKGAFKSDDVEIRLKKKE